MNMKNRHKIGFFLRLYAKISFFGCRISGVIGHDKPYINAEDGLIRVKVFSDQQLAKMTGRTVRAIQQRKYLLNKK